MKNYSKQIWSWELNSESFDSNIQRPFLGYICLYVNVRFKDFMVLSYHLREKPVFREWRQLSNSNIWII